MEAAAKKVQWLTQHILPEKPHHLSYSPNWRYRIPADEHKSKRFEEWDNTRLQYVTLVSEADRGVLLTRSYYDMRVEPQKPVPREVNALSKAGGEKKKLSLSDYKNKKTTGVTDTTLEPPSSNRRDRDMERAHGDAKLVPEVRKPDAHRSREVSHPIDAKPHRHRENIVDMRLPPKPPPKPSLPPRPMSPPDSRKRMADADDDYRSQKRARPDPVRTSDDRSRSRDDPPRRKDRDSLAPSDYPSQRDTKPSASSSLLNGRSSLKNSTAAARNPSPAGRARGDSLNGARPNALGSTKNTPTKFEGSSRPSVPPLLSPLHLNLDGRDGANRGERKKAREDAIDGTRPAKPKKQQEEPPRIKREKSPVPTPLRMPALLSPTLPPLLEAELSKRGKLEAKLEARPDNKHREERDEDERVERRSEERPKEDRISSATARKAPVEQDDEDSGGKEKRKSLIVTLYISKRIRQSVKRYLALPLPRKEPSRQDRSVSIEAAPAQAKKRPASATEIIVDSISVKRPRTSSISSSSRLPPPPSTPSKKGTTAMSRVSSNNSAVHTPGDAATATPSAPQSSDRPIANGTEPPRADKAELRAIFERQNRFSSLGRRLKHNGDVAMKRANANSNPQHRESGVKLGYVLTVESIIAFMASFQALNLARGLSGKACDPASWESMFPLLEFLQKEMRRLDTRRYQPLYALILMLHAVSIEEVVKCYATFENASAHITIQDLIRHERSRARLWPLVRDANEGIDSSSLRASITPWSSLDEISSAALRIIRHWCADENVDWSPEVSL
ncbi:hypothetical protein B0J13DRAFT_214128 [Dactylonectria estremocensis]|uniref:Uncharacterized protein n=1 Tax=Dactylonectria estremocensis TaxID=1079267 RepID=A0A9P9JBX3_9HYPO|nr:hypothetical protein B0J13DRAFT_214128 [Dactylonectria estremocensis]